MDKLELLRNQMAGRNLFLIGFMGVGKTAVSELLGIMLSMDVVEMDQTIAARERMSIPDIFATHGEDYFRDLETNLLIEMQSRNNTVISCGGGVVMQDRNVAEMKKNGYVILLTALPETILKRVMDSDERPLLMGNKNTEFVHKLMEERRGKYEDTADIVINTDQKSVPDICEELVRKLTDII